VEAKRPMVILATSIATPAAPEPCDRGANVAGVNIACSTPRDFWNP
jgi:hypothetical protein